jgi:hypothetical protein
MSFRDTGLIVYDPNRGTMKTRITNWCVLQVDKEITRYYRWWARVYGGNLFKVISFRYGKNITARQFLSNMIMK